MINTFKGYKRENGAYGIRNHVAVLSTADNTNFIARRVSQMIQGTIPLCPCFGRGEIGADMDLHIKTMGGLGANPNVHSVVIVSLEEVIAKKIADIISATGKEVYIYTIDECGSSVTCTEQAVRKAAQLMIKASMQSRVEIGMENLIIGLECGGSDTTSGVLTNPAIGQVSDKMVQEKATVILSETTEWMGAESIILNKVSSQEVYKKIVKAIKWYEDYIKSIGIDLNGYNPAPDNIKGGISTIEEKALGSIKKAGVSQIQDLIYYADKPTGKGLYLMDAPTGGIENATGLAAAGCQLILFSTGKGNPLGNPIVPTIKITGNEHTAKRQPENIDVDVSFVLTNDEIIENASSLIYEKMLDHANGKLTTAEVLSDTEIAVTRIGFTV